MYGSMKLADVSTQLGHVLPQRTPTGEVLSVSAGDSDEFGALTEVVSRFAGALIAYLVIASLASRRRSSSASGADHRALDRFRDAAAPAATATRGDRADKDRNRPRWQPTLWRDCAFCEGSAASRPSPATTLTSRSGHGPSRPVSGRAPLMRVRSVRACSGRLDLAGGQGGRGWRPQRRPVDQFLRLRDLHGGRSRRRAGPEVDPSVV